jgi:hypothetical protein
VVALDGAGRYGAEYCAMDLTQTGRTYFVEGYVAGSNDAHEGNRTWWRYWTKRIPSETEHRDEFEHGYFEGKEDAAKGIFRYEGLV